MAGGPIRGVTFWGVVGATMTALKLKESWDDYRQVSSEEDGHGRVALRSPLDAPPSYTDEDDLESAPLRGEFAVDTEIPRSRPVRKTRKDCCVCCGLKCSIFWKAFGFACMVFIVWLVVKTIIWTIVPAPTGLEKMPVFGTSLGCLDEKYFYDGQPNVTYSVALSSTLHDHRLTISGVAIGTLTITSGAPGDEDLKVDMSIRTGDSALLDQVSVFFPTSEEIEGGTANSRMALGTPRNLGSSCMRYDLTLHVPDTLKSLRIESQSVTHLKFDPDAKLDLDVLSIVLFSADTRNLLLPTAEIQADHLSLEMTRGWMYGDVSIGEKTSLTTQRGDATSNIKIHPSPSLGEMPQVATLQTTSGAGRSDFTWISNSGFPHRPISSVHGSSRWGDLYLTYKDAEFNGHVDMDAKSYSVSGVQNLGLGHNQTELPWVGNKDGGDNVKVRTPQGWVGLYF